MNHSRILLFAALVFLATGLVDGDSPSGDASLRADLKYLSSEELRGRSVTDDTIRVAAEYVANRMKEIGLKTDLVDGTPFQPVEVMLQPQVGSAESNKVVFRSNEAKDQPILLGLTDGMSPLAIGAENGQVQGRLVFVGYGITAPKLSFDDYEGVDVAGATVIVIRKEPRLSDPDSPFDGTRSSRHAYFATKINNAIQHGAAAIILVNDPQSVSAAVKEVGNRIDREKQRLEKTLEQIKLLPEAAENSRKALEQRVTLISKTVESLQQELVTAKQGVMGLAVAGPGNPSQKSIPVVSVSRDAVSNLLKSESGQSLAEIEAQIDDTTAPASFELANHAVDLQIEIKPTVADTGNVVGTIPGRGELADQTIVVGAHYDHVGMGGYGSLAPGTVAIHNGADDNASGTVTMLQIAERMTKALSEVDSHRRVLFIGFTGEERGLIGSKHYVDNPIFPLANTTAMVNLDMVGRLRDNELTVYGTGSATGFDSLVDAANEQGQFDLLKVASGYGPSDHQSFYQAGVPVLFFFTGLHNDYHRPTDDFDKINFNGMTRITDIVSEVTLDLATDPQRPEYAETEKSVQIRRQMTAYLGVSLKNEGDHVVLSGLVAGGAAEKAGLKTGDQLEKLGKRDIATAEDVLIFMRTRSPGQEVKVRVLREGKTVELTVRLESRPDG
ncbi:MAG: M28 family peptidase [Rubripirellula sp.]|nr:M28 family peptidase [Rubripirellula sp.]